MGSFLGHLLPGIIFFIFGLWLSVKCPYRYFSKNYKQKKRRCCVCNVDMIEAYAKILSSAFGILMEQVTNDGPKFKLTNSNNTFWDGNNWSHCTMYLFFMFSGVADVLILKFPKKTPTGINHLSLAIALLIEGFLFYFHTHGRNMLEVRIHVLLVVAIWVGAAASLFLWILDALCTTENHSRRKSDYMELNTNEETIYRNEETLNESDSNQSTRYSTNGFPEQFQQRLWLEAALNNINESKKIVQKYSLYITLQMVTAISILLQGTWFFQIAAILYPPGKQGWDVTAHINVEFATIFFTWHLAGIIIMVTIVYYFVGALTYKCDIL